MDPGQCSHPAVSRGRRFEEPLANLLNEQHRTMKELLEQLKMRKSSARQQQEADRVKPQPEKAQQTLILDPAQRQRLQHQMQQVRLRVGWRWHCPAHSGTATPRGAALGRSETCRLGAGETAGPGSSHSPDLDSQVQESCGSGKNTLRTRQCPEFWISVSPWHSIRNMTASLPESVFFFPNSVSMVGS